MMDTEKLDMLRILFDNAGTDYVIRIGTDDYNVVSALIADGYVYKRQAADGTEFAYINGEGRVAFEAAEGDRLMAEVNAEGVDPADGASPATGEI